MSVAFYYKGWAYANSQLVAALAPLTDEQLRLEIQAEWPIWASASHIAGMRVYWLCHVFGEPGAEENRFTDAAGMGWEDDLSHPRSATELSDALRSSWRVVERCLETWTPEMLTGEARRVRADGQVQHHTRQSVLFRMITHDAFHAGEISLALGEHGLGSGSPGGAVDLWSGLSRVAE